MQHRIVASAFVAALALTPIVASCSSDDDAASTENVSTDPVTEDSDTSPPDTDPPDDASVAPDDATPAMGVSLTLSSDPPPDASVSVTTDQVVTDRILRRGTQPEIDQGQTFLIEDDTTLTGVSFQVMPSGDIPANQAFELGLYDVGNLSTMIPSNVVDLGVGSDRLVLAVPEPLDDSTPVWLTFSFPEVDLTAGTTYAAVLSLADGGGASTLFVQHVTDDRLVDGTAIFLEGSNWKSYANNGDTAFALMFA